MNIFRHGDILLKQVEPPKNLKSLGKFNEFVLALGETTGHRHLLTAEPETKFEVLEDENGQKYLKLEGGAELTHEEHNTIQVLPAFYVIGNEREFNYFSEATQRVQD